MGVAALAPPPDDGFDDEEDDLPAVSKGPADTLPLEAGLLAGSLLCEDLAFARRPAITPAAIVARARSLGLMRLDKAPAGGGRGSVAASQRPVGGHQAPSLLQAKQDRVAAAARAAAAALFQDPESDDDAWDAVTSEALAAGGAASAAAKAAMARAAAEAAATMPLVDSAAGPLRVAPEPLRFLAAQLHQVARARSGSSALCMVQRWPAGCFEGQSSLFNWTAS